MTWAVVELIGWLTTHFWPAPGVNWVWLVLTVIGLIPMIKFMPLRSSKLRNIMLLWIVALAVGMIFSFLAFTVAPLYGLAPYLGVFWLLLMGAAFLVNALWWTPRLFLLGGVLQIAAGLLPLLMPSLLASQYLIAAVAGTAGMLILLPNK